MEYSPIQLNDISDEILISFKKLPNAQVLYSLSGVHKRLNKIVHDSIFTNDLSLVMSTRDRYRAALPCPETRQGEFLVFHPDKFFWK